MLSCLRTTVVIYLASHLFYRFIVTGVYCFPFPKNNYTSSADDCLKIDVLCCVVIEWNEGNFKAEGCKSVPFPQLFIRVSVEKNQPDDNRK